MKFDTTLVRFVSSTANPSLPGMVVTYTSPSGNTLGKLVFSWTGPSNVSLADGASLANLTFSYVTGTGLLNWNYTGCHYLRNVGGTLTALTDTATYLFYLNGGISNRGAPVTYAPLVTVLATGPVGLPITVNGFTGIGSLTLNLEYDPAILTYLSYVKNPAFGSSFLVGNIAGTGGKRLIVIQWYGNSLTLASLATLCTLNFNYTAASSNGSVLTWFDNIPSCQYTDGSGAVLIDLPKSEYYHNGLVSPPIVSVSVSPSANPVCVGTAVTYTATGVNGGTTPSYQWKVNGINAGTNNPAFSYVPANNDMIVCVLTSSGSFVSNNPATSNQVAMSVLPLLVADFMASNLAPRKNDTVQFTDLSTGSASSWTWSFDRPDVVFLNGTDLHAKNPLVKFTDGGLFSITLAAASSCFSDSEIKPGYIRAGVKGLWSGTTSSEWNNLLNWDNYQMPDSSTNVEIPPSAPNWPVFDGDLTLGIHCGTLTLSGTTSRLTITGTLTIP